MHVSKSARLIPLAGMIMCADCIPGTFNFSW